MNILFARALVASLLLASTTASAADRFAAAAAFVKQTENRVYRDRVEPQWLPDGKAFWYRVQTGPQREEFVLIEAGTGARKTAANLAGLGLPAEAPLATSKQRIVMRKSARTGVSSGLVFVNQLASEVRLDWINPAGEHVSYGSVKPGEERKQQSFDGHVWLLTRSSGERLAVIEVGPTVRTVVIDGPGDSAAREARRPAVRGVRSPDGKWSAAIENGRVMLRHLADDKVSHLRTDLEGEQPFRGGITWSPDSSAFVASCAAEIPVRKVSVVDSSPRDALQPKVKTFDYRKPGDPLPQPTLVLFRVRDDGHDWQAISSELFPNPFRESDHIDVTWSPDSKAFYFDYNERGHQRYRILAADAATGAVRTLVEETSPTFIDYANKTWRHWLMAKGELIWMSERDGWCHLWLIDIATGEVKNRITQGTWPVRRVLHVDEAAREVFFLASGLVEDEDPYYLHLCKARLDGSGFARLTTADGNHRIEFSPDRECFIAAWSRVDQPPVHELRRTSDGKLLCTLETADASDLLATGWSTPERLVATGRDGQTKIHGILIKPSHFDPEKKYPVVEEIYAGPHSAHVPKDYGRLARQHMIAELGFIVVQIDGMGTNHRGKAFHDICWKNLRDAGFPDRIRWIQAAAATRPWMDVSRVGIYGGSAGGQNAMRALLDHHDFYHVAVADCGCHDNRMDKIWWNEQWLGWPIDDSYAQNSNAVDAAKLAGRLLLIVGELDTNVDPASTQQVVGALQRAGKSFDYMPIIGAGHGAAETPYGSKLRMEFLVRHLNP